MSYPYNYNSENPYNVPNSYNTGQTVQTRPNPNQSLTFDNLFRKDVGF